ncbi:hypothetical protein OEA41_003435 [Lepraria neglecta]|uniref:D-arabinono-1,4-lactone oxidase n=1 Tax=Lepraria neglecta TaxID=209136 RepID=A0AAD9Z5Q5_9LECA|nr:hypothetical protein OEA41_003435 [Lepraria neglecta]
MAFSETPSHDLLDRLQKHPDNEDLIREISTRVNTQAHHGELSKAIYSKLGKKPTWANCIGQQKCSPERKLQPTSRQDLLNAVKEAESKGWHLRVVGSGHSFSNVCPTDGILLDPHGMKKVLPVDASLLLDPSKASNLFSAESGMTIERLNGELDKRHLALANMGAYDGQTLAGAISTGTHGTGISLGPIASSVRSLVLVSGTRTIYQIEPSNGITDPAKFAKANPDMVLKQDDDWFQSSVIAMGCMGLIYSYTLEVMPAYFLEESRVLDTWEGLTTRAGDDTLSKWLVNPKVRHFEVDINPYAIGGYHACIKVIRKEHDPPTEGSRGIENCISGILASCPVAEWAVVHFLNLCPSICPTIISSALKTLVDSGYVDKSYKVMNIGAVDNVKAMALELSFDATGVTTDATKLVHQINNLLAVFAEKAKKNWYLAGPVALRFVADADAYLAPQAGRVTCMAELDLLVGINNGENLLREVKEAVCTKGSGVRVHWGLDLDTVTGDEVHDMFPKYDQWLSVYKQLNSSGMFNSVFTDRLGISVSKS